MKHWLQHGLHSQEYNPRYLHLHLYLHLCSCLLHLSSHQARRSPSKLLGEARAATAEETRELRTAMAEVRGDDPWRRQLKMMLMAGVC